ncbi:MAG: sigma-70 family RNA polymerase sigma factor [Chlorobi bacterium]|nr:sigma-70 family RNA polymerase sigma factor [Chlorobiota bacterium]
MRRKKKYTEPFEVPRDPSERRSQRFFNELYDRYAATLYGILQTIVHDQETAKDLLQESFVKIWQALHTYDAARGAIFTWMLNIVRNTAIDYLRSRYRNEQQKTDTLPDYVNEHENWSVQPEVDHIGVGELLDTLSCDHRRIVELAYYKGYTHSEIAEELGIPIGTVKTRLRAAIVHLRHLLCNEL